MNKELVVALENLGAEGIDAFYVYIALDYGTLLIALGLFAWGARTVWNKVKDDL